MRLRVQSSLLTVNVVAGTSAILFSIDMEEEATNGLLGFYIRKKNMSTGDTYDITSIKHFKGGKPDKDGKYSTEHHPWQSFLWEDFYVQEKSSYEYYFKAVFGAPEALTYSDPVTIKLTVPAWADGKHEVYFNRGVAASQAYAIKFGNQRPDAMSPADRDKALKWLSRGLKEAMLGFIAKAKDSGWGLRCCFYEFIYPEVLEALKQADKAHADVKIIYDSRHEAGKNDNAINTAGLKRELMIRRAADPGFLQHNKYMILLKGGTPVAVWTGSTNITEKAIFGQCNVGHIIKDESIARQYLAHWTSLQSDPVSDVAKANNMVIQPDLTNIENGTTVFFSPRSTKKVLKLYSSLMEQSAQLICGMFPFSFNKLLKAAITAETNHLKYIIIDKKDKNTTLVTNDFDNVIVYGTKLDTPLYEWAKEKNSGEIFYSGTNYIHNKVILIDPLSDSPVVISGSANFSDNSIANNDENTLVIKGDKELADQYFAEFCRIFNHYAVRQDIKKLNPDNTVRNINPTELKTKSQDWVPSFFSATALKCKRRNMFSSMTPARTE